jgi:hypothetical protein
MNRNQRVAALDADADAARPVVDGIVVALTQVTIGGQVFNRGQVIGPAATMASWGPQQRAALLANKLIEVRSALPEEAT